MEPKEGKQAEEGTTVSPVAEEPAAEPTKGPAEKINGEDTIPPGPQGAARGLEEGQQGEPQKEDSGEGEAKAGPGQEDDGKGVAQAGSGQEDDGKEVAKAGPGQEDDGKEVAKAGPGQEDDGKEVAKAGPGQEDDGKEVAKAGPGQEDDGKEVAKAGTRQEDDEKEEAKTGPAQEGDGKQEAKASPGQPDRAKKAEAGPGQEDGRKEEVTVASLETADRKDKTRAEPRAATEREEASLASQKQVDEKEALAEPEEKDTGSGKDKSASLEAGRDGAVHQEAKAGPQIAAVDGEPPEADGRAEVKRGTQELEAGGPGEEQEQDEDREPEEGPAGGPSSPDEWPESPSSPEDPGLGPDRAGPASTAPAETSPPASESSPSDAPHSPTESPPAGEKPERRVSAAARPRAPRAQNRKAIVDKFGGAASGPTALFRNTKAAGAAIGSVKSMLLEWCRAMTRKYEHVDVQNFSSSWSSGMAFCALVHKFFPDAFDYAALDPTQRRHNFTLAFSTAETLADCAQLLDVDDMVRLAVPDSKCVYTYIQELYRCLVQKGLVKTKKK